MMTKHRRRTNGAGESNPERDPGQATARAAQAGGGIAQAADGHGAEIKLGALAIGLIAACIGAQVITREMKSEEGGGL